MVRSRVLLGCLQPEQASSLYSDALNRLVDQLHYLSSSGDKSQDSTRFWFDIRANLRREMEERKKRFEDKNEVRSRLAELLKKLAGGVTFFDGVHIMTPHADVPDDSTLRLILLPPEQFYSREEPRMASDTVMEYVRQHGTTPRYRGNRLLFLAPDHGALTRLRDCIRTALAWNSIVEDVAAMRLVLDNLQAQQAKKELQAAEDVLPRVARETYKWLLCPSQEKATDTKPTVEQRQLNTSSGALGSEIERVCLDNEWVIPTWSPIHLRTKLSELYWKADKPTCGALAFWEDTLRYLYLPRLKSKDVLAQAISKGAASRDFFGTAYGQHEGKFDGFKFGDANVQLDDTLLLIEPSASKHFADEQLRKQDELKAATASATPNTPMAPSVDVAGNSQTTGGAPIIPIAPPSTKAHSFYGSVEVKPAMAKMRLVQIAEEIIANLTRDPNANVSVTVEIHAEFPNGASDQTKRAVAENATNLGFKTKTWE